MAVEFYLNKWIDDQDDANALMFFEGFSEFTFPDDFLPIALKMEGIYWDERTNSIKNTTPEQCLFPTPM